MCLNTCTFSELGGSSHNVFPRTVVGSDGCPVTKEVGFQPVTWKLEMDSFKTGKGTLLQKQHLSLVYS